MKGMRIWAILQLCVVFSFICWVGGAPFLGEVYEMKVARQKYECVVGDPLFEKLPAIRKARILEGCDRLQRKAGASFGDKIGKAVKDLFIGMSLFARIWVVLGVVVPLFLLLGIEGALQAVWLLPLVAGCGYAASLGGALEMSEEEKLFPTEQALVRDYIRKPLEGGLADQRKQLQDGWDVYLEEVWGGAFNFNVARIEAMQKDEIYPVYRSGAGLWLLGFIWNFLWAIGVTCYYGVNFSHLRKYIWHR